MHTLITFLGKGRDNQATGYRTARYRFADGTMRETPYFGMALAAEIRPDRIVMLGTGSSMWDVLVEHFAADGDDEALRMELMDAVAAGSVDEQLLARVAPLLTSAIGTQVEPHLIGTARDASGQNAILELIADNVCAGQVSVDLTHAFRHLGMIGFQSAFMLERLAPGSITIDGLWYGALDMTADGVTPVLRLDGLQDIQHWIDALNRFDASGNYGVFAPLLEKDGMPANIARCLREAAFRESTMNLKGAREKLLTVLKVLEAPMPGASGLFQGRLRAQLLWAREGSYSEYQRILALRALDRRDYSRASMLGVEAILSRLCEEEGMDALSYEDRDSIRNSLRESTRQSSNRDAHRALNTLRNSMVHGTLPEYWIKIGDREARQVLQNESELDRVLRDSLVGLLGTNSRQGHVP